VQAVAGFYNQNIDDLRSDSRKKELSIPRQLLMLIAKKHLWRTLEKIGEYFGGKSHATVIYSLDTLEKTMKSDINIRQDYESIIEQLGI
jgi:chromosomal replication initiator protein